MNAVCPKCGSADTALSFRDDKGSNVCRKCGEYFTPPSPNEAGWCTTCKGWFTLPHTHEHLDTSPNEAEKESPFDFPGLGDLVWASWLESVSPKARDEIRAAVDKTQKHIARLTSKLAEMEKERTEIETAIDRVYANFGHVPDAIAADWIGAAFKRGNGK